jgi:uncharacterized protein (DUF3820 family)
MMDDKPYRMTFGKHVGKHLHELPPDYRAWLTGQRIYENKEDLKAALMKGKYLAPVVKSEPSPITPPRKRKLSETESVAAPPSAKKLAISQEAKCKGTMPNDDGAAYILSFGKYAGQKLTDVPPTYIDWLMATKVHDQRPDLAAALRKEGLLVENHTPDTIDPIWRAPTVHEAEFMDTRFFDDITQSPLWISDIDVSRYFRLGEPLLSKAGVYLVTEAALRRSTEYVELLTFPKGNVRWLYQVYACAGRYGSVGAAADGRSGVEKALRDFLGKNRRREREIWLDMGLD